MIEDVIWGCGGEWGIKVGVIFIRYYQFVYIIDMVSEKYMRLDFVYRKLQKLRDLVREQKVLFKISDEIDEVWI